MAQAAGTRAVALALGAVGGALLLTATFAPWSGRGAGSSIALRRIADLVLSGTVDAWVPRSMGLLVYAIPLGGALVLVGTGLGGRAGAVTAGVGVVLALSGTVVAVAALDRLERSGMGPGLYLAGAGAATGIAAVATQAWPRRDGRDGRREGDPGPPSRRT